MKYLSFLLLFLISFQISFGQVFNITNCVRPSGPTININPVFLNTFSNTTGTASTPQTIATSGSGLSANVVVTPPSGFEVSQDGTNYASTQTIVRSGNNISATISVRVAAATAAGSYSGNVSFTSSGATTQNCAVTATVATSGSPTLTVSPTSLSGFGTVTGTQSSSQSFNITGTNLTANASVTPPASYLVSTDNQNFSSSVTVIETGGTINSTPIYVIIASSASVGSPSGNVTIASSGATSKTIAVSGTVTSSGAIVDSLVAQFNFNNTAQSVTGWTDVSGDPHAGLTATDFTDFKPVTVTSIASKWIALSGAASGNTLGYSSTTGVPSGVGVSLWYNAPNGGAGGFLGYAAGDTNVVLSNLDPTKLYTIQVFSAQNGSSIGCGTANATTYMLDSVTHRVDSQTVNTKNNVATFMIFKNKVPDAAGRIQIGIYPQAGGISGNCNQYGILNGMTVTKQAIREGFDDPISIILLIGMTLGLLSKKRRQNYFYRNYPNRNN